MGNKEEWCKGWLTVNMKNTHKQSTTGKGHVIGYWAFHVFRFQHIAISLLFLWNVDLQRAASLHQFTAKTSKATMRSGWTPTCFDYPLRMPGGGYQNHFFFFCLHSIKQKLTWCLARISTYAVELRGKLWRWPICKGLEAATPLRWLLGAPATQLQAEVGCLSYC